MDNRENPHVLLFRAKNANMQSEIQRFTDNLRAVREAKIQSGEIVYVNRVQWFTKYVNSQKYIETFPDTLSLEIVAEATYFSEKMGLCDLIIDMRIDEVFNFKPIEEMHAKVQSQRSHLIESVCNKLVKPVASHELSYAIRHAVFSHLVATYGYTEYEKMYAQHFAKSGPKPNA